MAGHAKFFLWEAITLLANAFANLGNALAKVSSSVHRSGNAFAGKWTHFSIIPLVSHAALTIFKKLYDGKNTTMPPGTTLIKFDTIWPNSAIFFP